MEYFPVCTDTAANKYALIVALCSITHHRLGDQSPGNGLVSDVLRRITYAASHTPHRIEMKWSSLKRSYENLCLCRAAQERQLAGQVEDVESDDEYTYADDDDDCGYSDDHNGY